MPPTGTLKRTARLITRRNTDGMMCAARAAHINTRSRITMTDIEYTKGPRLFGTSKRWYASLGEFTGSGATRTKAKEALLNTIAAYPMHAPRVIDYRTVWGVVFHNRGYGYTFNTFGATSRPLVCMLGTTDTMNDAERALRRHIAQWCMTKYDPADDAIVHTGDRQDHIHHWRMLYNHHKE